MIYKYSGKPLDDGSVHLLIYHCLDVAAVGKVFLQNDHSFLDKITQNTTLNKEKALSMITFYLTMHDLGKFSNGVQNGDGYYIHYHSIMGFRLWSQIWEKIWRDNLLGLDKSVDESIWKELFEYWFESVMNHHKDFQDPPPNVIKTYFIPENIDAACSFVEQSAKLLIDINSKTPKIKFSEGMHISFKSNSKFLNFLTEFSDQHASEFNSIDSKYFKYRMMPMYIGDYWYDIALPNAKCVADEIGFSLSEIFRFHPEFSKPNKYQDKTLQDVFKRNSALAQVQSERLPKINNDKKDSLFTNEKFDRCLFEILKNLRDELDKRDKENRFSNPNRFSNENLEAMATYFPQDSQSFENIDEEVKGKFEGYGEYFLEKIVTYCNVNNNESKTISEYVYPTKLKETLELCKLNFTLEEIAEKRNLPVKTIARYIEELILFGAEIPVYKFVPADKQEHIIRKIIKKGCEKLKSIQKELGDCYTDEEIRIVRANKIRNKYLFNWNHIPGNDDRGLKEFFVKYFGLDWVKTSNIKKINGDRTIRAYNGKNYILLKLNYEKTNVNIEIDDDRTELLIADGNLNIYRNNKYISDITKNLVEFATGSPEQKTN